MNTLFRKANIIFFILFFLSGCATTKKETSLLPPVPVNIVKQDEVVQKIIPVKEAPKKEVQKKAVSKLTDDVLTFIDLQQVDLDNDGRKEIIAAYITKGDLSGVKVISPDNGESGKLLFNRIFNNKSAKVQVKEGVPIVTFEDIDESGRSLKKVLVWNGATFIAK